LLKLGVVGAGAPSYRRLITAIMFAI